MPSYESIHTGSQIDTAVGRASVGGAIDTSLSRKADTATHNLKSYTNPSQLDSSLNVETSTVAEIIAAMPICSVIDYYVSSTFPTGEYPYSYVIVTIHKMTNVRAVATLQRGISNSKLLHIGSWNGDEGFGGWQQLATATTPTEYDLPMADVASSGNCTYAKTQEGVVIVNLNFSATLTANSDTTVGTLPSGFRPSGVVRTTCTLGTGVTGRAYIGTNGIIAIIASSNVTTSIGGLVATFIAGN